MYARHLATAIPRGATAETEQTVLFRAITAYRAVVAHWPADIESVVAAGMAEADLWLQLRNPHAAASILERLLPAVSHSDNEPSVYRRLGVVYHRMNRVADAEQAFARAEVSHALARHPLLAIQTLRDAALFYERTARPVESAKRYRQLSRFEHIDIRSRALAALDAVRASAKAKRSSRRAGPSCERGEARARQRLCPSRRFVADSGARARAASEGDEVIRMP